MAKSVFSDIVQKAIVPVVDEEIAKQVKLYLSKNGTITDQIKQYLSSEEMAVFLHAELQTLVAEAIGSSWQINDDHGVEEVETKPASRRRSTAKKPAAKARSKPQAAPYPTTQKKTAARRKAPV